MKPKCIGIIGGTAPLAGAFLLERIFSLSMEINGSSRNADFPQVFLINFPFSEMLSSNMDAAQVRKKLNQALNQLRENGTSILAIACNTLHVFLDKKDDSSDFIHLSRLLAEEKYAEKPLVFCTSTSVHFGLHKQYFPCLYLDAKTQKKVGEIIDQILQGADRTAILKKLKALVLKQNAKKLILGCTELSLFSAQLSAMNKIIIDRLEIMTRKILKKSFQTY